jgi:hypothetical protein
MTNAQNERKHNHYFRPCPYDNIDVYRIIDIFEITCPAAQHVLKKVIATGKRGHKDVKRDWEDIIDSAQRKLEMLAEESQPVLPKKWPEDLMDHLHINNWPTPFIGIEPSTYQPIKYGTTGVDSMRYDPASDIVQPEVQTQQYDFPTGVVPKAKPTAPPTTEYIGKGANA